MNRKARAIFWLW